MLGANFCDFENPVFTKQKRRKALFYKGLSGVCETLRNLKNPLKNAEDGT